jgi:dCTP deaminase
VIWRDTDLMAADLFPDAQRAPGPSQFQPASVDLRLMGPYLGRQGKTIKTIDLSTPVESALMGQAGEKKVLIRPGDFLLAQTMEVVRIPADAIGRVEGRSSVGRLGLSIHVTAGFIDPGFHGSVTLELANLGPYDLVLQDGIRICQLAIESMTGRPRNLYGKDVGSAYQGQFTTTQSRYRP